MLWRPPWRLSQHAESFEHDATRQRVVSSTRTWKGAVQVGVDQDRVCFPSIGSIRNPYDDIGKVTVGLV